MLRLSSGDERQAFTLIELMLVVVLIGVLSAIIIPEMKGTYGDALLRSTSRELVNVFSIASSRAVSLNQLHRVRLDLKSGQYVIEKQVRESPDGGEFLPVQDNLESAGRLDQRISIEIHKLDESPPDASVSSSHGNGRSIESISFYPDGTADPAELLLRDRDGFRLALRINPITSHVKILQLERE